jgi:hypothetical protein
MALSAAAVVTNKFALRQESFKSDKSNGSIVPLSILPDKKEWLQEHHLLMLMLDG